MCVSEENRYTFAEEVLELQADTTDIFIFIYRVPYRSEHSRNRPKVAIHMSAHHPLFTVKVNGSLNVFVFSQVQALLKPYRTPLSALAETLQQSGRHECAPA